MVAWIKHAILFLGWLMLGLAYKLGENAVLGWADNMIADYLGLSSPTVNQIYKFIWLWALPLVFAAVTLYLTILGYHWWYARYGLNKVATFEQPSANTNPMAPIPRISVLDLFHEAERRGLRFMGDGDDVLEFVKALRQAGSDGTLIFWGRNKRESDPLIRIPAAHWHDFSIDWEAIFALGPPSGHIKGFKTENFPIGSRALDHRIAYFDLHVDARASKWITQYVRTVQERTSIENTDEKQRSFPDWPIQELFFHIRPSLRTGKDVEYQATALAIKDKLSTGQLDIWGRTITFHGEDRPLRKIVPTYWRRADFTYAFFFPNGSNEPHTCPDQNSGSPEYYNLQVNKKQVAAMWPSEATQVAAYDAAFAEAAFIRDKASRDAAVLRLAQLRTAGVEIRNEAVAGQVRDDNLESWLSKVTGWMNDAIHVIWQIDEADSELFKTLDEVHPARFQAPIRLKDTVNIPVFVKSYNEHDNRLVRVRELLKKYTGA